MQMASSNLSIHEGDTIVLYSTESKGFIYATPPPNTSFSHVTIYPVLPPHLKDPVFPNVHFASFQVLSENSNLDLKNYSPLTAHHTQQQAGENKQRSPPRCLVYGRKIKLLHVASKKYLSIPHTQDDESVSQRTASVDTMTDDNKNGCLFRILHSHSEKERGNVNSEDSIKLKFICKESHSGTLNTIYINSKCELTTAVADSTFVVYSQSLSKKESAARGLHCNQKILKGGDVILLFDMKKEAYVSGCGSSAIEYLPDDIKEDKDYNKVGARHRPQGSHSSLKGPPISGDSFWQFEKTESPLSNDAFHYDDKCRLKHLPTQQYLAVNDKNELTLKKFTAGLWNDPQVTFSLTSAKKGVLGAIAKGAYLKLRYIETGKNLTVRFSDQTDAEKEWFELVLVPDSDSDEQCFRMEEVADDLIHEYYRVSGVVSVLQEYIQKLTNSDEEPLDELNEVVLKLSEWIGMPSKYQEDQTIRASMLRVTKGVDLLVGFLHQINEYSDSGLCGKLCQNICYALKKYVEISNQKSHMYLANERLLKILLLKIGKKIGVERVLSSLIYYESGLTEKIVQKMTEESSIAGTELDSNTLDLLGSLCFIAGKPSHYLQKQICDYVIKAKEFVSRFVLYKTKVDDDGQVRFVYPEKIAGSVLDICTKLESATSKESDSDFRFFVTQLKFFSRICKGVNSHSISECQKLITFEEALICIDDPKAHPLLKLAYLEFVISAFVDCSVEERGTDIDNIRHLFYWDLISSTNSQRQRHKTIIKSIPNAEKIEKLRDSIKKTLTDHTVLYAKEPVKGQNELLTAMLSLMELLVSYGFYMYATDDIILIGNKLISILDGATDRPEDGYNTAGNNIVTNDEYSDKHPEKHQEIFIIKTKAVNILHQFFKQLSYMALKKAMFDFKVLDKRIKTDPDDSYTPINECLATLLRDDIELAQDVVAVAQKRLRFYYNESAYPFFDYAHEQGKNLVKILIDLMKYENDELRLSSTKLLFDVFQGEKILFSECKQSYIMQSLQPEDFSSTHHADLLMYHKMCHRIVMVGALGDRSKMLLRLMQGKVVKSDVELSNEVSSFMDDVSNISMIDHDETVPNYSSQWIAYSSGIFQALLTYVIRYSLSVSKEHKIFLDKACCTLRRILKGNSQIQAKLFLHFIDLVEAKTVQSSVAQLLAECVTGNIDLCRKLSEADIRLIFLSAREQHELYIVLETIIKANKHDPAPGIEKHQDVISHIIVESIPEYFNSILTINGRNERLQLLKECDEENHELVQLLYLIDLLATCTAGQCKFADSCQEIFSLEELLNILSDKEIKFERKKPFARLLDQAYLNTERDSLATLSGISKQRQFWIHIEECANYIRSLDYYSRRATNETSESLKKVIRVLFARNLSLKAWLEVSKDHKQPIPLICDHSVEEEVQPDSSSVQMNILLLYIFDGFLPLLTSICTRMEIRKRSRTVYSSLLSPQVIAALKTVGNAVSDLVPKVFITTESQKSLFKGFLESLVFVLPPENLKNVNQAIESINSNGEEFFHSPAVLFQSNFKNELSKNEQFRTFIKNFEKAYNGFSDDSTKYEGSYILPGGCSFHKLIDVFCDKPQYKVQNLVKILDTLHRQQQLPLTGGERAEYDSMLLTTIQILSGIFPTLIKSIDHKLQSENPKKFEKEYEIKVKPILQSCNKVMRIHLSHPNDEIVVQLLEFLRVIIYPLGNEYARKNIGNLTVHQNTEFFTRISQFLDDVVTSLGQPTSSYKPSKLKQQQISVQSKDKRQTNTPPPPTGNPLKEKAPPTSAVKSNRPLNLQQTNEVEIELTELKVEWHQEDVKPDSIPVDESDVDDSQLKEETPPTSAAASRSIGLEPDPKSDSIHIPVGENNVKDDDDTINDPQPLTGAEQETHSKVDREDADYEEYVKTVKRYQVVCAAGQLETTSALKRASIVLDLVSWLCNGQNREMQETLRQQGFAFSNKNIVTEVAVILQTLAEHINFKNMAVIKKAIQALIAMCAGNYVNQETTFKGQIVDSINTILQANFRKPSKEELSQALEVKSSAIELLEVMLEETHEKSQHLAKGISDDFSVPTLLQAMVEIRKIGDTQATFKAYHVLRKIVDYLEMSVKDYVESKVPKFIRSSYNMCWQHLGNWSRSIEINYITKDNKEILTRVYFPFNPSNQLSEGDQVILEDKINRQSTEDKLKDLLKWMEAIKKNKNHKAKIRSYSWLSWTVNWKKIPHFALIFSTLLLNFMVLFLFKVPNDQRVSVIESESNGSNRSYVSVIWVPDMPNWFPRYALFVIGTFHLFFALWMVIGYFVREAKNFLFRVPIIDSILWDLKKGLFKTERVKNFFVSLNKIIFEEKDVTVNPPDDAKCFEIHVLSFGPLYRIFFCICSILALIFHGYFYCGCLLYLFLHSSVSEHILTALRRSAIQLIVVGLLGAAIIMIYAVLSFAFLHEFFDPNEGLFCDTLWQCFVSVSRLGLLDSLGGAVPVANVGLHSKPSFRVYTVRMIFDLSFLVIITILGLNIVIAILVDRFCELRSEKDEIKKDKLNYCFICGIDNDTFERDGKGFRDHVQNDHSKWNYIYFLLYLDSIPQNDLNTLEKYVFDKIHEKRIKFFPIHKAKVLPTDWKKDINDDQNTKYNEQRLMKAIQTAMKSDKITPPASM